MTQQKPPSGGVTPSERKIAQHLIEMDQRWHSVRFIADEVDLPDFIVNRALQRFWHAGKLERKQEGDYYLFRVKPRTNAAPSKPKHSDTVTRQSPPPNSDVKSRSQPHPKPSVK